MKKGLEELDQYKLSRSQYAKKLGITPNAVRMRMRHGKLNGEYWFNGSKFLFKEPEGPRENHVTDHPQKSSLTTLKKTYNRGNHFNAVKNGNYPNEAFKLYNERKKEIATLNKIQGKFKDERHEAEFNRLNKTALDKAYKDSRKKLNDYNPLQYRDYGSMLNSEGLNRHRNRQFGWERDYRVSDVDTSFRPNTGLRANNPYEPGQDTMDDGSVSFSEYEIDRMPDPLNNEPRFKNKIEEEIWRLKNKK
jgi:hypothetical protein